MTFLAKRRSGFTIEIFLSSGFLTFRSSGGALSTQPFTPASFVTFGDLLKYLRRRERLTQLELSIAVGYSEAQISRLEKNQRVPDLAAVQALFVPVLHLEQEPDLRARLLTLAQSARQEDAPAPGIAPYKGLLFFDEADADVFFGRETLTSRLADRMTALAQASATRILAIVGASGSGKSSLVRAGLAATLTRQGWEIHLFTPTIEPLACLEAQLNAIHTQTAARPLLLLVDQFEETFTLCHEEATRVAFIDRLLSLASSPQSNEGRSPATTDDETVPPPTWGISGGGAVVLITLRADFYAHCAQYPQLRQAVAAQQEYIGQMTTAELRRAIEEPAKRAGWEFEPGLVELLLRDIGAHDGGAPEPGALPLLSHALLATWERRRGRTLTLDGYRAVGGVRSAIAETAESVFTDQLDRSQQEQAREVFLRLTELGEGTEDTRRRARLTELVRLSSEAAQVRSVLNTLAEARLITLNEDSAEVAHEALIREWARLHEWLTQDREGLRIHRHLTDAAREWEALGRDAGALYRGARLAQAREWTASSDDRLNETEHAFLAASVAQEEQDALEREVQRQRELETAQKLVAEQAQRAAEQARTAQQLRQRARLLAGALLLVALLAGVAFVFGRQAAANASAAETARQVASVRELAASAANNLATDPERSMLLALQAVKINIASGQPVLVQAEDALHQAVQTSRLLATLDGHEGGLWALALSNDGSRLATVSMDGTAKVWDLATKQVVMTLPTNVTDNLSGTGAVFSPDGQRLLTVGSANRATLWDLAMGKALYTLDGHTAPVTSVAVSPDGKLYATASDDTTVKLWNAATGQEVETLTGRDGAKLVLAFSPDGQRVYAGSDDDGMVIAWDVATGQELFRFDGQGDVIGVDAIAASPDGTRLATGEFDTTVRLWDTVAGRLLLTLFGHSSQVVSVAFSADGNTLASASEDGTIKLWDAHIGRELRTLAGHTSGVLGVTFSADGNRLYSASRDGTARIWDISPAAGRDWLNLAGHTDRLYGVDYRPDGTQVATWSWDGTVKVWDTASGKTVLTLNHPRVPTNGGNVVYSPDGKRLAFNNGNGVQIVDADSSAVLQTLPPFDSAAVDVTFAPDGHQIAAATSAGLVRIYDSRDGSLLLEFTAGTAGLQQIAFSPDGKRLAISSHDGAAIWDASTGKHLLTFSGHGEGVRTSGIAFSPDGKWVASTGNDAAVQVWDAETGEVIFKLAGHTGPTFGVAFSPDGRSLASSSVDRTIKLWNLPAAGEQVPEPLTLLGHTGAVYRLAFSPDGARLASTGRNATARIYALRLEDLVAIAQSRLTRALTDEECRQFLHTNGCR
jgi:WD40 repeat protein/transcriptional regulator with XRE-family HTH domain